MHLLKVKRTPSAGELYTHFNKNLHFQLIVPLYYAYIDKARIHVSIEHLSLNLYKYNIQIRTQMHLHVHVCIYLQLVTVTYS